MNPKFDVQGKVALVTGANRGIGKTIVESLIKHGAAKVYAAVRKPDSAQHLVDAHSDKVVILPVDVSKPETVRALAEAATDVQLVVNNAGVLTNTAPMDSSFFENLDFEMSVNVYGLIHMAQTFAPILKANGGGAFVQLNSVVSLKSFANVTTYSASKAASYSITQALRESLTQDGIVVLSVHPGPIATDMIVQAGLEDMAEPTSLVSEGIVAALKEGEPHFFAGSMAQGMWKAYEGFARTVIETDMSEG